MPQRRSIKDSLSTKEIEFLKQPLVEAVKPSKSNIEKKPIAESKSKVEVKAATSISENNSTQKQATVRTAEQWVPLSTRVPKSLHTRLRRIAFDRQELGVGPNSIQDMLVEAAESWLERESSNKRRR